MLSLESIRIFMRAADTGSFSAAGRTLRLSPSVISYRIQTLEEHLGCLLLTRTTRRMNLTEAGRVLSSTTAASTSCHPSSVRRRASRRRAPRGTPKVTAPLGLGRRVLAPLIPAFRERHAEADVHLRLSDHLLDLVQEAVDVAVRLSHMRDSTFTLRKVADVERILCAAPSYLAANPAPESPVELLDHSCLVLRFPGSEQFRWTLLDDDEALTLPIAGRIDADDSDVLTEWALLGQGIALEPIFEVAPYLADGRLVPVLPQAPPTSVMLGVLYPSRKMLPNRAKTFVEMATETLRAHVGAQLDLIGRRLPR